MIDETVIVSPETPDRTMTSTPAAGGVSRGFGKCSLSRLGEIDASLRAVVDRGTKRSLSTMELDDEDEEYYLSPAAVSDEEESYNAT